MMTNRSYFNQINRKKMNGPSIAVLRNTCENGDSPVVMASGKGELARRILEKAKENDIAIQRDSTLMANFLRLNWAMACRRSYMLSWLRSFFFWKKQSKSIKLKAGYCKDVKRWKFTVCLNRIWLR